MEDEEKAQGPTAEDVEELVETPTKQQPNIQKHETYFRRSEEFFPTQIKCLIEAKPGLTFYDKKDKSLQFSPSSIEIIANSATFLDDRKIHYGNLFIVAKFDDEKGQRTAPDLTIQKRYSFYSNISDLVGAYNALNSDVVEAYAKREKVKLIYWDRVED